MTRTVRWGGALLVALAATGSCGKDKTTALDIKLELTGAFDQIRVDAVSLANNSVPLTGEQTLFPSAPRMLATGDVLTLWFADAEDMKVAVVSATGRLCGRDASAQATTVGVALAKGQTVQTTLALTNNGTVCAGTGTGGAGGTTGGTGGAAGSSGGAGTGGLAGGSAGTGGAAGGVAGTTGAAGTGGGTAGRGGTTGTAGTGGGTAGRGGTTGAAGTGGAAGRGGTTGAAGSGGGAAGSGGTTSTAGTGGAAGRGGTTGTGGTSAACATTPANAMAQAAGLSNLNLTTCGYPVAAAGVVQYLLTGSDYFALASPTALANGANCGRCVELVYTVGTAVNRVTLTVVGGCDAAQCPNQNFPSFGVNPAAFQVLTQNVQAQIPMPGTTLTYSFVPCPLPQNQLMLANVRIANGAPQSVLFVQQRYGIASVTVDDVTTAQSFPLSRSNDSYWWPPSGAIIPASARFHLTDVNNAMVTSTVLNTTNVSFSSAGIQFPLCPSP